MADTVKIAGECWSEGVKVPCPAKKMTSKPKAKKKMVREKDPIKEAVKEAKERQRKFGSWGK